MRRRSSASRRALVLLGAIAAPLVVSADPVTIPHDFVDGTPADAAKVNDNFEVLEAEANAQEARLDAVESQSLAVTDCAWSACFDAPEDMACPAGKVAAGIQFPEWGGDEAACGTPPNNLDDFRVWCCQVTITAP